LLGFHPVVAILARLVPPTIHPMVLHFPIVLLYLTACVDLAALVLPDHDRFLQRVGFWTLTLAAAATIAAMAAGVVSEQSVRLTPPYSALLETHQHFAMLTGLCEGGAWLVRLGSPFSAAQGWTVLGRGRGRGTWASTALVVAAAVCVTLTASIGGRLVYDGGAGVLGVTRS
jgi:uncharacterized membrane protein